MIDRRKISLFLGLAFGLCWTLALAFWLLGGVWHTPRAIVVGAMYMLGPALATFIVQRAIYRQEIAGPLWVSFRPNRWFLVAWLGPAAVVLAAFVIGLSMPGTSYAPDMAGLLGRMETLLSPEEFAEAQGRLAGGGGYLFWLILLQGLLAGATINAVFAFGEELGWRGFLQRELSSLGFWNTSVIVGFIWGIWHAPIILMGHNYPQYPVAGIGLMTLFCMLAAPLLAWVTLKARSVVAAAVAHGTLNGTAGLSVAFLAGGNELLFGITGLAGMIVLALAVAVLWVSTRRQIADDWALAYRGAPAQTGGGAGGR